MTQNSSTEAAWRENNSVEISPPFLMQVLSTTPSSALLWVTSVLVLASICYVGLHLVRVWPIARRSWRAKRILFARNVRPLFYISPEIKFLHLLSLISALLLFWVTFLDRRAASEFLLYVTYSLLFCTGLLDLNLRFLRLLKTVWAPLAGKFVSITVGAAAVAVSIGYAKHVAFSYSGANPAHFPQFVALVSALVFPIVFFITILTIICCAQLLGLIAIFIRMAAATTPILPARWRASLQGAKGLDIFLRSARQLSTYVILLVIFASADVSHPWRSAAQQGTAQLLVAMEFYPARNCLGIGSVNRIAFLDEAEIVVAKAGPKNVSFSIRKCERSKNVQGD